MSDGTSDMQTASPGASDVMRVDPQHFPLHGSRLIEASAGTGKTFTIAALYLRLVLGHGSTPADDPGYESTSAGGLVHGRVLAGESTAFTRALNPPDILVVTFTDAATAELRERIRARLAEAAAYFRAGVIESLDSAAPGNDASIEDAESSASASASASAFVESAASATTTQPRMQRMPAPRVQGDSVLSGLRASIAPEQWAPLALRLQLAAEWMDEAAVSTIHSWASRMLREHAFDSGSLFSQKQVENDELLLDEAFRDYWRSFVQQFDRTDARLFARWWKDLPSFQGVVRYALKDLLGVDREGLSPDEAVTRIRQRLQALKADWDAERVDILRKRLLEAREKKHVHGGRMRADAIGKWMDALLCWVEDESLLVPFDDKGHEWMDKWCSVSGIRENWKDGSLSDHPVFGDIQALLDALSQLDASRGDVLVHAARWIEARHRQSREQRGELSFDDMLTQLDQALSGADGDILAQRIREQFPVAMIDEFQDTDPLQYRIFDRIYRIRDNDPETALILIGDPKQAIYAFRDADIYTYLQAREATAGRHYTLDTNYRSSIPMVEAVNHLFACAEERPGALGAFRFGRAAGMANPVPFLKVGVRGRKERWIDDEAANGQAAALTIWCPEPDDENESQAKGVYQQRFARATAAEIARLLQGGQQRRIGFGAPQDHGRAVPERGVRPADIAVLVNARSQADLIRTHLRKYRIPSVYLSDKESVFDSPAADDLLRFLSASAEPGNGALVRAALASSLAALPLETLLHEQHDELSWENRVAQFQRYQKIWRRQGVLPMIRQVLADFAVVERLLAAGDERLLTDVLHLAELLHQASVLLDGEQALIRYLKEQRTRPDGEADTRRQRLESDDERVRIVTVHKSKGLEYPLVFIPFFCDAVEIKSSKTVLNWHDARGHRQQLLTAGVDAPQIEEARQAADAERLGEDLRKLYVALTRARHATWIGVDAIDKLDQSAAAYLLGATGLSASAAAAGAEDVAVSVDEVLGAAGKAGQDAKGGNGGKGGRGGKGAAKAASAGASSARADRKGSKGKVTSADVGAQRQQLRAVLDALVAGAGPAQMRVCAPPVADDGLIWQPRRQQTRWKAPPSLARQRWPHWWIASYSSLGIESRAVDAESAREAKWMESAAADHDWSTLVETTTDEAAGRGDASALPALPAGAELTIHDFPRGPRPGSFLHGLLEWAGQQGFASLATEPARVQAEIDRRLQYQPDWQPWRDALLSWFAQLLNQPLLPASLASLSQYQIEMSFMLPVDRVDVARFDRWACAHLLPGMVRPALADAQLNGMLKGFIDLVFEHEGRYYVLDYKSNWLGTDDAAYDAQAMRRAMMAHRYDVQSLFYLLALHRLLKTRLPDYDYARDVGGAIYLFMRGLDAASGGVFRVNPPAAVIESLDAAFRGDSRMLDAQLDSVRAGTPGLDVMQPRLLEETGLQETRRRDDA